MRKIIFITLIFCFLNVQIYAKTIENVEASSYVLMDGENGNILLEKNKDMKLPPASITKIMTMLLTLDAINDEKISLQDVVTVSETAAQHEGSHVYLASGEQITVHELLKAVAVASGNDAANALAEYVGGDLNSFVKMMNLKAKELHMDNTFFVNCNGLDAEGHLSTASDIAKMTFEISKHPSVFDYTSIWMDTLRNGAFQLSNTNKLIRFYDGATGMKTGYTSQAGYCLSATAERGGVKMIAVVMHSPTSSARFGDASTLLNYGFENYTLVQPCKRGDTVGELTLKNGQKNTIPAIVNKDVRLLLSKKDLNTLKEEVVINKDIVAPVTKNTIVGEITFKVGERVVGGAEIVPIEETNAISFGFILNQFISNYISWK